MKLSEWRINSYAIILSVLIPQPNVRKRILEMGFVPGTKIIITKRAPLGDPIGVCLRGYELCISKEEASYIFVRKFG